MKYRAFAGTMVSGAIAVLLSACGGGGSTVGVDSGSGTGVVEAPAPGGGNTGAGATADGSLTLSGTAAVGLALSGATITAKCAEGAGSTTSAFDGSYRLVIPGGVGPCMLQASGTAPGGAPLVLHSAVFGTPAGTPPANIPPLTELGLAQGLGSAPAQQFSTFDAQLAQWITEILQSQVRTRMEAALEGAGVGLNGIDPFLSPLQAAYGATAGNGHDQLLDRIGALLPPSALPLVVNQLVVAAAGLSDAKVLADALSGGSLPGCSTAVSGQYRTLDLWGKTTVRDVDFKNMRMRASNGVDWLTLTANANEACSFVATGTVNGRAVETSIVIGTQGAGAYRTRSGDPAMPEVTGYIFPAQPHSLTELNGTWSFLSSGYLPGQGSNHYPGEIIFDAAAGTMNGCNYDTDTWNCNPNQGPVPTVTARTDGGFDITSAESPNVAQMYGYRTPSGALTLFGSQMMGGYGDPNAVLTSIVASKLETLPLPRIGDVTRYWNVEYTSNDYVVTTAAPRTDSTIVDTVDRANSTVTRHRSSDGRADTLMYNQPLTGTRLRLPGETFGAAIQIPLQGLGIVISANAVAALSTGVMFHVLSVERP